MVSLEKHVGGRYFLTRRGEWIPYKRNCEAIFEARFNPKTMRLEIKRATFGYALSYLREDFYELEKGIKWKIPDLIPWQHRVKGAVGYLMEPSTERYPDYSRPPPKIPYKGRTPIYERRHRLTYARRIGRYRIRG